MGSVSQKIKRLSHITNLLKRTPEGLTTKELSQQLNVTQRCIQKDIKILVEMGLPLKKSGHKYKLGHDNSLYIDLLSESEIFFLLSLNRTLKEIYPDKKPTFDSLIKTKILPTQKYEEVVLFGMDYAMETTPEDKEKIRTLIGAILTQRRVSFLFEYRRKTENGLKSEKQKLKVEPYRIGYHRGFWYLIGAKIEEESKTPRVFSIYKISDIEILSEKFEEIPEHIKNIKVFRPYLPEPETPKGVKAKIKVMPEALIYFRKKKFAKKQELKKIEEDGSGIFEIEAASLTEILQLIVIPWIPHVIVLEPPELAREACRRTTQWFYLQREYLPHKRKYPSE